MTFPMGLDVSISCHDQDTPVYYEKKVNIDFDGPTYWLVMRF